MENSILNGVARRQVIALAKELCVKAQERPFSLQEAKFAGEAFLTLTSSFVTPAVKIDDTILCHGRPSAHALRLHQLYMEYMEQSGHVLAP